ncbi:cryptochrome/photolyase family protein [Halomarina rubra]|uniref:Cryptochrome/photolyase family protein n=1 Tax=Halomarina rubra TaxID=2071873 RepID=A0ABD6B0I1_9EURY|nr:cryptochrome/photolyase family protein [Halomarina rubra]
MTVLVLGDQLTRDHGPIADGTSDVLMVEATAFATRHAYHPHKLALVFAAMRQFRDDLRETGHTVHYHQVETFAAAIEAHFEDHPDDELVVMDPPSYRGAERLRSIVEDAGGALDVVENDLFLVTPDAFDEWFDGEGSGGEGTNYRHEAFYRWQRRETGYLMDGDDPEGGEWNLDDQNQEAADPEKEFPDPPRFDPDELTRETVEWVEETFDGGYDTTVKGGAWADPEPFFWPVTRAQALDALADFCEHRLAGFGPYQDAMLDGEWSLNHLLLSPAINLGLLHPREVVEAAIETYRERDDVPLNSVEGFVRQLIGWREFMRQTYRREMPEMATANLLDAPHDLPEFYWTSETEMHCLSDVVGSVRERGYTHHIPRLMLLSNFALTYGVEPAQVNEWFHAAYVDAYHWVTTPNVVGMGVFGTDVLTTKPYASSANYVDRMSDYCSDCAYAKTETTGENACPFNALYWDFLGRHEDDLRNNYRIGPVYGHWDGKDDDERREIHDRADEIRELAESGDL